MVFLLSRTTRIRQRWRDGEGALGSCLNRDVAAINIMHFCCFQIRAATTNQQTRFNGAANQAAKSEGAAHHQPRFAAPRRRRWTLTLTCVAAFTRRAQDITASYATGRRVAVRSTCIRRHYVKHRHTQQQPAQPTTPCRNGVGARHVQATHAPAACERRALDGVAASCVAMKRDGVKRLRQRRETSG